jgi:SulP family sulfate permease
VVQEAVKDGGGDHFVAEDVAPTGAPGFSTPAPTGGSFVRVAGPRFLAMGRRGPGFMARTRYQYELKPIPLRELPAAALRAVLREGYSKADVRSDVLAGVVVGIVALPLAMALSIAVGAPPQHGVYTAIVAGFLAALLGGSRTQVTGPTAAFIVILAPIFAKHGMAGLLLSGILAGLMLIVMGLLRLGRLIEFIPYPVTTGFTAGIATVIATLQLKDLFGLTPASTPQHFFARVGALFEARGTASLSEFSIGAVTLAILIFLPRHTRRIPAPLVALPVAALLAALVNQLLPAAHIATISSRFHTDIGGQVVHGIPQLPPLPVIPWLWSGPDAQPMHISFAALRELLPGAFAIAMLGAIESLLSAVVADGMARTKHDPDAELLALGLANVVTPFFGGIPATGAIARTATNVRSGARSPFSSMAHAVTILVAVVAFASLIGYLPMASLAALLLLVAWNMSDVKHFIHTVQVAPKSDVAVLLVCYGLTVAFDMVVAVSVGVVLAALLFMRRMAEVAETRLIDEEHPAAPANLPKDVVLYDISGPLFFGAAEKAVATLGVVARAKIVVLRMDKVPAMDATGLVALESALAQLNQRHCLAIITGLQPQPKRVLASARIQDRPGQLMLRDDLEAALLEIEAIRRPPPSTE